MWILYMIAVLTALMVLCGLIICKDLRHRVKDKQGRNYPKWWEDV